MADSPVPDLTDAASPPRRDLARSELETDHQLDRGGQAVVYAMNLRDDTPPDKLAWKEPLESTTLSNDSVERFLVKAERWATVDARERRKSQYADSEHIVGVIDTGDELPWIAMEYMDGGDLNTRIETSSCGLPVAEALWIGERVCRALDIAHNNGIVHLDIKPANVLFHETPVDVWDVPKLADWGLARLLAEDTGAVEARSPKYSAPEQFDRRQFGSPDTLTDVYQAGALVYAMLTGTPPYTGPQFSIVSDIIDEGRPDPPSTRSDKIPERIDETVLKALSPMKADRYEGTREFRRALKTARSEIGGRSEVPVEKCRPRDTQTGPRKEINSRSAGSPSSGRETGRKSRWGHLHADLARTGNAAEHTGPITGIEERWSFPGDSTEVRTQPVVSDELVFVGAGRFPCYFYALDRKTGEVSWEIKLGDKMDSSPSLRDEMVYIGDDTGSVHAVDLTAGETTWQINTPNRIDSCSPAVTSNSVYVGSGSRRYKQGHLCAVHCVSGEEQWRTPNLGGPVHGAIALADGRVYAKCQNGVLYSVSAEDGSIEWERETNTQYKCTPAVIDDTVYTSIRSAEGKPKMEAIDPKSGSRIWLSDIDLSGSPTVVGDTLYAAGAYTSNGFFAIDIDDHEVLWRTEPGAGFGSVYAGGALYTGGSDGVYCFDAENGETNWSFRTGKTTNEPPAVLDDEVYVVNGGTLYAFTEK